MSEELEVSVSSGNVFEDLGLADSGELMAKAKLAAQVSSILQHRHLTQAAAAEILGITQLLSLDSVVCWGKNFHRAYLFWVNENKF